MLFHTPEFLILLILLLPIYWYLPKGRLVILSLADIVFYSWAGVGYLGIFFTITLITHICSLKLYRTKNKMYLWSGIIINVANLMFFKYSVFFLRSLEPVLGVKLVLPDSFWTTIILPIGISFYTFMLIAYLVDIYRDGFAPTNSFIKLWVFISFFGHLVAGPIMRGKDFIPQIDRTQYFRFNLSTAKFGIFLIVLGLIKKIMLADQIAPVVNQYFSDIAVLSTVQAWAGAYLFAFQIYLDFSAYSDMALGLGYLCGYELAVNFRTPYLSASPAEFWRRWHITLSSWIRDYIYIPLGGSRKGRIRTDINLMAAMLISGLWHGAMWTFVLWGGIHGLLLIGHKMFTKLRGAVLPSAVTDTANIYGKIYKLSAIFVTFHLVTLAWVFFRAPGFDAAINYILMMLKPISLTMLKEEGHYLTIAGWLFLAHIIEAWLRDKEKIIAPLWHRIPGPLRGFTYVILILLIIGFLQAEKSEFIYFQF